MGKQEKSAMVGTQPTRAAIVAEDSTSNPSGLQPIPFEPTLSHQQAQQQDVLRAYGSTFVLAPAFSLRMDADDSLLLASFVQHQGLAVLILSECQPLLRLATFEADMAPLLCDDAHRVLYEANAGGSSTISEAMSMEILARAFGGVLQKTELELTYWPSNSAITDFSIRMGGVNVGVSVTRAMSAPNSPFTAADADRLLKKKLQGVICSTATCCNGEFAKQILHIWVRSHRVAALIERAYDSLEESIKADTVIFITKCGLAALFTEKCKRPTSRERTMKGLKDSDHLRILQESDPCRTCNVRN